MLAGSVGGIAPAMTWPLCFRVRSHATRRKATKVPTINSRWDRASKTSKTSKRGFWRFWRHWRLVNTRDFRLAFRSASSTAWNGIHGMVQSDVTPKRDRPPEETGILEHRSLGARNGTLADNQPARNGDFDRGRRRGLRCRSRITCKARAARSFRDGGVAGHADGERIANRQIVEPGDRQVAGTVNRRRSTSTITPTAV